MVYEADTHYDRKTPWSSLGTKVDARDLDGIIAQAGLNWQVETVVPVVDGLARPDYRAIRRTDTDDVFGFAKKGYTPVQNRDAFGILEDLLDDVVIESAGQIRGGRRVWIQARVPRDLVIGGDEMIPYLTIATSHDGSSGVRANLGFLRLECTNQFNALHRSAVSAWSHRHSTNVLAAAKEARKVLGLAVEEIDLFEDEVRRLIDTEVTARQFDRIVAQMFPVSDLMTARQMGNVQEKQEAVRGMYASERDGGRFAGTAWGVVNAFNSFEQWAKPVKDEAKRAERQAIQILDGSFGAMTRRVADLVLS